MRRPGLDRRGTVAEARSSDTVPVGFPFRAGLPGDGAGGAVASALREDPHRHHFQRQRPRIAILSQSLFLAAGAVSRVTRLPAAPRETGATINWNASALRPRKIGILHSGPLRREMLRGTAKTAGTLVERGAVEPEDPKGLRPAARQRKEPLRCARFRGFASHSNLASSRTHFTRAKQGSAKRRPRCLIIPAPLPVGRTSPKTPVLHGPILQGRSRSNTLSGHTSRT